MLNVNGVTTLKVSQSPIGTNKTDIVLLTTALSVVSLNPLQVQTKLQKIGGVCIMVLLSQSPIGTNKTGGKQ